VNPRVLERALRRLVGSGDRPEEAIVAHQEACLRQLVRHAYARVPYYRQRFDEAGIDPRDIRTLRDLAALPITTRDDLQSRAATELCAKGVDIDALRVVKTSGSTGAPLTVRRRINEGRLMVAFRMRDSRRCGVGLRWRLAAIDYSGPERPGSERRASLYERFGVRPQLSLDWRTPKHEVVDALARFQPDAVCGPPSILAWIADDLTDPDRRRVPLRLVITGSETLTPPLRERIERGFGAGVADVYGCHETVYIAMRGLHAASHRVCRDAAIVEVLRDGKPVAPGDSGELLVTGLHLFAMPFLRYRLGDLVTVGEVTGAGETVSALRSIDGRAMDRFVLPGERLLHPYVFSDLVQDSGLPIRRFQVIQPRRDEFLIRLVLRAGSQPNLEAFRSRVSATLGPGVGLRTEVVAALLPTPGSKLRTYIPVERLEA
jgi:phenylacetate-CoA ligase